METPKVYLNRSDATVYGLRQPMPIQIVCGDCSARADGTGDIELLPLRTFLGVDGRCYTCGGGSYVIASELCGQLRRTITERRRNSGSNQPAAPGEWSPRRDEFWKGKHSHEGQYGESDRPASALLQPNLGLS